MRQIGSIQILRALAALMVVLAHAQDDALHEATKAGFAFARTALLPWVAGVDLFFVISGFIMVYASERLFAAPGGTATFLVRRIIRVLPLYWMATGIMLVVFTLLARHGQARVPSLAETLSSLGFVPYARPGDGTPRPVMPLGWTLNYEMFFYVVFAAFLFLRRNMAVLGVALTLGGLVSAGTLLHPSATAFAFWSDPIVLEFALGMSVALVFRRGVRLPRPAALALGAAGLGALAFDLDRMGQVPPFGVDPNGFGRLLACGVPMAAIFAASVLARCPPQQRSSRIRDQLVALGDASYALYLFHPFVIVGVRKLYLAAGAPRLAGGAPMVVIEIVAAILVATRIHRWAERPVTAALQRRFQPSVPTRPTHAPEPLVSSR